MNKPLIAMIAALLVFFSCPFLFSGVTSGADFLKIPRSARAIALGESYTAIIDDPTAIDYNPAALNTMRNFAVSMMFQSWIDNSYGIYTAAGYRFRDIVIGGSFYFFNYGGLTAYDDFGGEVGNYNPYDMNIKIAASVDGGILFDFLRGFSVGGTVSAISRNLVDQTQWGFAVDAGVNYKTVLGKLIPVNDEALRSYFNRLPVNAGFVIQNLGYAADTLTPVRFSGGLSVSVIPDLIVSMDLTKDVYNTPWMFKMGVEYTLFEILSLRGGFNLGRDTGNGSLGLGLRYPMLFNNLRFDYAFTPLGVLGNNHNFSLYGEFQFDITAKDYLDKGKTYFYKQDYLKAREMWEQAFRMEPGSTEIRDNLVSVNRIIASMELETNRAAEQTNTPYGSDRMFDGPGVVVKGTNVTFYYRFLSSRIRSVAVTGDFINWNVSGIPMQEETNGWTVSFDLRPGLYQYQYVINGSKRVFDPANPDIVPDGKGGLNSCFEVKEPPLPVDTNINTNTNTNEVASSSPEGVSSASSSESSAVSSEPAMNRVVTNAVQSEATNAVIQIPIVITNVVRETNVIAGPETGGFSNRTVVITEKTNVIRTSRTFYYKPQTLGKLYGKKYSAKKLGELIVNNLRSYYFYNSFGKENYEINFPLYGDVMFDLNPDQYLKKKEKRKEAKPQDKKPVQQPVKKPAQRKAVKPKPAPVKEKQTISNWLAPEAEKKDLLMQKKEESKPVSTNTLKKVSPVIETYR